MYRLLFQSGVGSKEPLVVHAPLLTIGRDASCQLPLLVNGVADHHARIERRDDGYYLRDLNSPNGVSINGRLITERRLASGDELEVGSVRMRFEILHDLPGERRTRRPLDLLQFAAVTVLVLVIGGQIALLGSIFSETRPKKMNIDTKHGWRGQQAVIGADPTPFAPPAASDTSPSMASVGTPVPVPAVLHRMIRIVRVERSESANSVAITIQAKAQVGERELDVSAVRMCVQFAAVDPTSSSVVWPDPIWLPIPAWDNFANKAFTVRFPGAPKDLAGFVVRSYYRNQMQDVAATPASLQTLAPIPMAGGAS
jgi:hypothetical protein